MKLFLASLGITDNIAPYFAGLLKENKHSRSIPKGYIIENASDYKGKEGQLKLREYYKILKRYGIDYGYLDLKEYKGKTESLKSKLDSADFVYVSGGNIFYLYYWIVESGFDKIIEDQIKSGLVYAGSSAGSIIAGPTLKYFDVVDKIPILPKPMKIKWEGLNLIDFVILPHWGVEKYKDRFDIIKNKLEKDGFKIRPLTNTQAFSISDKKIKLIEER